MFKYVRWELELALKLKLPIVAANLNKKNGKDGNLGPALIRDNANVGHIPYTLEAIKHAISDFPVSYGQLSVQQKAVQYGYSYKMFDPNNQQA